MRDAIKHESPAHQTMCSKLTALEHFLVRQTYCRYIKIPSEKVTSCKNAGKGSSLFPLPTNACLKVTTPPLIPRTHSTFHHSYRHIVLSSDRSQVPQATANACSMETLPRGGRFEQRAKGAALARRGLSRSLGLHKPKRLTTNL